jgi:two-component system NtrC family sensor kinase
MGEKNARSFRIRIQDSIAGQVVRTGRPVMIGGTNQDDSFKVTTGYFVKALLNVPLKVSDQVIGVLAVNNKRATRAFSERHLGLLLALADYASIAIDNARLYARLSSSVSQAEQSSRELEKLVKARTVQLDEANQQLLKVEKLAALGYMAAGVAKEIDTPIANILKYLYELGQSVEPTPHTMQLLAELEQEALHCQQVVQSLFDFSAGQKKYEVQEANLNDIIEAAWDRYSNENGTESGVEFVRGFDPNLPPASIDSKQLEQAMYYLIRNAYRSMPSGGTLRITSRAVGPEIQVIVSDTGQGISQEDIRHIFDPFYEAGSHSYGIDLSITHGVIEGHHGTIEVESQPGQGTTFTIHLPQKS